MTAPCRITVRLQIGDRIIQHIAEGDDFDSCVTAIQKMRAPPEVKTPTVDVVYNAAVTGCAP